MSISKAEIAIYFAILMIIFSMFLNLPAIKTHEKAFKEACEQVEGIATYNNREFVCLKKDVK